MDVLLYKTTATVVIVTFAWVVACDAWWIRSSVPDFAAALVGILTLASALLITLSFLTFVWVAP